MPFKDKDAQRACNRASYARNKKVVADKTRIYKANMRQKWRDFKSLLSCSVCGEKEPSVLDFHHPNPSPTDKKIYLLLRNGAIKAAMEEAGRCVVLCANCHRRHHHQERLSKKKNPAL